MIDVEKLKKVIEGYKAYFPGHWKDENYKWKAIKHFHDHWNIDEDNFGEMFKASTAKAHNLLASGFTYPKQMIINFAKADQSATKQMFRNLYDESQDLAKRVDDFLLASEKLRAKYDDGTWSNHYQNTNTISTYLWLKYPDKYYIYKYTIFRDVSAELNSDYRPRKDGSVEELIGGFSMYDEINEFIRKDQALIAMLRHAIDDSCHPDPELKTATMDIGFYLSRFFLEEKKAKHEEESWFPKDYDPKISAEQWIELLKDPSVFTHNALQIMKRLKDYGGQGTCTQLSIKYGESKNFYNSGSTALARRIAEKTGCEVMTVDHENAKYWSIIYTGKKADKEDDGFYIWRLRKELSKALDSMDLSHIPLYTDRSPAIWKISHGTQRTGISDEHKRIFLSRNVAVVHSKTKAKATSKISQGQAFTESIREGDYFYLCYGNSVQLLGQFTGRRATENPELSDGWYERDYRIIAQPYSTDPYNSTKKWWTPNNNSTCIQIENSDYALFEKLILQPYFHMDINKLFSSSHKPVSDSLKKRYAKSDFLSEVFMSEDRYDTLEALVRSKLNVILQGAPGVGKTFAARKLAYAMMGEIDDSRIELIQFHQNYSYEDFIMGYRPHDAGFKLTHGIFYRFCQTATSHPDKEYFFIIDEINRGNMSKIFGELLMLIEKDYRETKATLAYNGLPFSIPKNLYIFGMMNTADRSLAMIDYALRRRFSFFEMNPGFDSDGFRKYQNSFANGTFNKLIEKTKELNQEIANDPALGRGFRIGHSYFCGRKQDECTADWMRSVVEFDMIPMLAEYWFDEPDKLQYWETNLRGVFNDK